MPHQNLRPHGTIPLRIITRSYARAANAIQRLAGAEPGVLVCVPCLGHDTTRRGDTVYLKKTNKRRSPRPHTPRLPAPSLCANHNTTRTSGPWAQVETLRNTYRSSAFISERRAHNISTHTASMSGHCTRIQTRQAFIETLRACRDTPSIAKHGLYIETMHANRNAPSTSERSAGVGTQLAPHWRAACGTWVHGPLQ